MQATASTRLFAPHADGGYSPAAPELIDRITLARADSAVHALAGKIAFRQQEIVRKAAYDAAIQAAVQATDPADGIDGVIQYLECHFDAVSTELADLNDSLRVAGSRAKDRAVSVTPLLIKAANAETKRRGEINELINKITLARRNGISNTEKLKSYRAAGLSDAQISKLGDAGPTAHDLEMWHWNIKVLQGEIQRLQAFSADPLHRISLLQGLELTDQDLCTPSAASLIVFHQPGDANGS